MKNYLILFIFVLPFIFGCGQSKVTGTVKFDDGTPLTSGGVTFTNLPQQASGAIKSDGSYELYELKPGDGVRPGTYQVTVSATTGGGSDGTPLVHLVDPKFENPGTSGLTCEVKGNTVFNITVTKPKK
ncbi:MAG: carboxypeptidase-like regulatory domain-containing protein [Planctomycetaceae bacterium]|nr:carboxypeptidase-like regulatory domain-containing protein [Planctomycetaceae bacterium]